MTRGFQTKHGESFAVGRTPEYAAWVNMIQRCENTNLRDFKSYGGRGIRVCERWRGGYEAFLEDMGRRPSSGHSLDRVDTDGNYEPGNCRWATDIEQARNRRNCRRVSADGRTMTLAGWEETTGIPASTIAQRIDKLGWSPSRAVSEAHTPMVFEFNGESVSMSELVKRTGVPASSLQRRIHRHGSAEAAVSAWASNTRGKR